MIMGKKKRYFLTIYKKGKTRRINGINDIISEIWSSLAVRKNIIYVVNAFLQYIFLSLY